MLKNSLIVDRIDKAAESDTVHMKIFVHGLGWDATTETLVSVFKQYGEILEANVIADKVIGKSKGVGFVLFKTRDGARKALKEPQKKIENRMTSSQLALFGPVPNHPVLDATGRKIFVAIVAPHVNLEKLRAMFAQYGEIEEGPLGYDRATGKLRSFAIFIYKTIEGCKKALEEPTKQFEGCTLQCRKAMDGLKGQKEHTGGAGSAVVVPNAAAGVPANNLGMNYAAMGITPGMVMQNPMGFNPGFGLNPALLGQNAMGLNLGLMNQNIDPVAAAALVGQNSGTGVFNSLAFGTGLSSAVGAGYSLSVNRSRNGGLGLGAVYGAHSGINSISPSAIGSYGSQAAALQGLGAYQSSQLCQPSATRLGRSHSGLGSLGSLPPYLGR